MHLEFEQDVIEIEAKIAELTALNEDENVQFDDEIAVMQKRRDSRLKKIYGNLTPWQTVHVARHQERPNIRDYISGMFNEFIELHGDRCYADDGCIIGGFARLDRHRVMLIGHRKGKTTEEKIESNFGMANPDGYRKALRLMKLAERFNLPVITLIDTPGAYPGMEAEARGQAEAIARNLTEMASLETPIISMVTGEGGSGGALGIGVGDVILMLSHAVYSVISPEGCASILWRDDSKAADAAEAMKMTADSLLKLGIIDEVIEEPLGGAHRDIQATMESARPVLVKHLAQLKKTSTRKLLERRFEKYASIGRH